MWTQRVILQSVADRSRCRQTELAAHGERVTVILHIKI